MMPIRVTLQKNGDYWQGRWRDARGRQQGKSLGSITNVSRRAAKVKVRQLEADLDSGRIVQGRAPTLHEHCERFLANKTDLAKGTVGLYRVTIRYLMAYFGEDCRIDKITRADASDWRAALARGELAYVNQRRHGTPCETTVCRSVRDAKAIFGAAADEDLLVFNPFSRLKSTAPPPDKTWHYVDRSTLRELLDACPNDGWRLLLALCRLAGLRRGEALRLRWSEVDLKTRRLTVQNPGGYRTSKKRTRVLPIDPELYELLRVIRVRRDDGGPMIGGIGVSNVWRDFQMITKRAGVEPWSRWCHTLRKNCETDWANEFPIHVVAEWLGNSPEVAMRHYVRAEDAHYREASGLD